MAKKEVEFHEEASREYEAAFEWYFERSEQAAARFAGEINRAMDLIVKSPQRWPAGGNGTRKYLLEHFFS